MRGEGLINENAVADFARDFLQRQRDQIAEAALGQGVLVGEKPVVGGESEFGPLFHGFREDEAAEFSRERGGNGLGEKHPDVTTIAGARALECGGDFQAATRFDGRQHILPPRVLVEIHGEEITGLIGKHRIDAGGEILSRRVLA